METVTRKPLSRRVEQRHPSAHPERPRRVLASLSQLLGSHLLLGLAGLASLPVLARNLGPGAYGHFSLFVLLLGALAQIDFSRPLLVRELAAGTIDRTGNAPASLASASALFIGPLVLAIGWIFLGALPALVLTSAALLYAAASAPYAELAADGRVGLAGAVRNGSWTAALAATVVCSFFTTGPGAYVWSFLAANLAILVIYRFLASSHARFPRLPDPSLLKRYRRQSFDLVGFGLATALVVSLDKLILEHTAPEETFGRYVAQYDLAVKLNILSTSLGNVLYPVFARMHSDLGYEAAAARFVRSVSWIAAAYFALLLPAILFEREIVSTVLGPDFSGSFSPYVVVLVGVFLHLFGFLITPWQRACGDFRTQRRTYFLSAGLMLVAGLVLIPAYGIAGAALTYLCARLAELLLIAVEIRRLPRAALPWGRIAGLAAMLVTLGAAAGLRLLDAGALP